jgi:DNA invertase Pin-like site-specific DNA recombinase
MSGTPAVAYLRRSSASESQEASLEQQRKAVDQYATEKGYRIIRWYVDDAISGDNTDQRQGFLQMIHDASDLGDFKTIICWDQKRFGRFNSIEYGHYVYPLMKAAIVLALVNGGVIDWNDPHNRIIANVTQEGAHKDLLDHAANVARGMQDSLNNASWVGLVPYAYRLEGKKHHKMLVLDDPQKAVVVARIFKQLVHEGWSMSTIAARLNEEDILSPSGVVKGWHFDSVKSILENPVYVGDFAGGKYRRGKYQTRGPAGSDRTQKAAGKRRRLPPSEWKVIRDHHEAIVDRATFEAAQAILAKGKTGRSNHYGDDDHPFILHGYLRCGLCEGPLWGMSGTTGPVASRRRYYHCGNRRHNGKDACPGTTVREDQVLRDIADYLRRQFFEADGVKLARQADRGELQPADLPAAFAMVKALVAPPKRPATDRKRLEKQARDLGSKIDQGRRNMTFVKDPETIAAMEDEIRKMKATRAVLEEELRKGPPTEKDINRETLEVLRALYWMALWFDVAAEQAEMTDDQRFELHEGPIFTLDNPSEALRPYLRKIAGITCRTEIEGHGNRTRHRFLGGDIEFKSLGLNPGNLIDHLVDCFRHGELRKAGKGRR